MSSSSSSTLLLLLPLQNEAEAEAEAKAAHTLNIFNCCCCCCCGCDAALFKHGVDDHSCAICFILFDTCTSTHVHTCPCVCVYLQCVCVFLSACTHVNKIQYRESGSLPIAVAGCTHYCLFTFISSASLSIRLSARLLCLVFSHFVTHRKYVHFSICLCFAVGLFAAAFSRVCVVRLTHTHIHRVCRLLCQYVPHTFAFS